MTKIEREKRVVSTMIRLYCKGREGHRELCPECRALEAYAHARLERCPFGEDKPMCNFCTVHCYNADQQAKIKAVMRYAGPRMLFHAPLTALRHLWGTLRSAFVAKGGLSKNAKGER